MKKVSEIGLLIYELAADGHAACSISIRVGRWPSTVGEHLKNLVEQDYLRRLSSSLYVRGAKGKILDAVINERSTGISGGSRRPPSENPNSDENPNFKPNSVVEIGLYANVHCFKVRALVGVESLDITKLEVKNERGGYDTVPFLTRHSKLGTNDQWFTPKGKPLTIGGHLYSFCYQKQANGESYIYTWLDGVITKAEMEDFGEDVLEKMAGELAQPALNYIMKYGGWRVGLAEYAGQLTPHIVPEGSKIEALRRALGPNAPMFDGKNLHIDHTPPRPDGLPTLEFNTIGDTLKFETALDNLPDISTAVRALTQTIVNQSEQLTLQREEIRTLKEYVGLALEQRKTAQTGSTGQEVA